MPKAASRSSPRSTALRSDQREKGQRKREEGKDGSAGVRTPATPVFPFFFFPSSFFLPWDVCRRDLWRGGGGAPGRGGGRGGGWRVFWAGRLGGRRRGGFSAG